MRVLVAALLAVAFLPPAVGADTLFYPDRLTVHDANGRVIGRGWPPSYFEFRAGSRPVILPLRSSGFVSGWLRFSNPGCTGQARVDALEGELYQYSVISGPRQTVWIQSGTVAVRTTRSTLTAEGVCIDHEPIRDFTVPVTATDVHLADLFVPPFTLRLRAGAPVPAIAP